VLSWRTKEEKLACLKHLGRRSRENSAGFQTTKLAVMLRFELGEEAQGVVEVVGGG
jgi:hypothetical protein